MEKLTPYIKKSPLEITGEGMKVLQKMGFKRDIDNHLQELCEKIDKSQPQNAFDVEQYSVGLMHYLTATRSNIFNDTEVFLYHNPDYNHPKLFKTAGLYLRDRYLEKHPESLNQ